MKKALALILVVLTLAAALCSCGGTADVGGGDASAPAQSKTDGKTEGGDAVSTDLPAPSRSRRQNRTISSPRRIGVRKGTV